MPEALDALTSYPGLALFCFLCGILVPLPEDVPQVWAGMQVAAGRLEPVPALLAVMSGVFARDAVFFAAGRVIGDQALHHPWVGRLIGQDRIRTAQEKVRERGPIAVLIGRFTLGFRTASFFAAGSMGVRWIDFARWDGLALLASAPLLVGLGWAVGEPVVLAFLWLQERPWVVLIALAAVLGAGGLWRSRAGASAS